MGDLCYRHPARECEELTAHVACSYTPRWRAIRLLIFVVRFQARLITAVLYHSVVKTIDIVGFEQYGGQGIFGYIVTSSRSPLSECDINGHKSDSTYFSDLDINRIHLITRLFKGAGDVSLRPARSNKRAGDRLKKMRVLLGGTCCTFRKEIKPYGAYEIHSRVLAWDEKWLYVVSYFVKPGSAKKMARAQSHSASKGETPELAGVAKGMVFTSAITKFVFKEGRKTIRPEDALEELGLLPGKQSASQTGGEMAGGEMAWSHDTVEEKRRIGMETAQHLIALDGLHEQFVDVSTYPFLGRFGLVGKVF